MGFKFGTFESICDTAPLQVCPLLTTPHGQAPTCYARNVELGGTLVFQPGVCFVHIVALIMCVIMIAHIRSKYTAVGRKEIVTFFYLYLVIELLGLFLDSAIIPTSNAVYPWFAAIHVGLIVSAFWCLLVNGFVGFQFAEDGTPLSLWFLRLSSFAIFGVAFFVAVATFKEVAGFSYEKPIGLFVTYLLFPLVCAAVYIVSQFVLVLRTLDDRWVIGDLLFGVGFFTIGCVLLFAFSTTICDSVQHYIDGLFFFVLCMLLTVMMVYKYWDSITKEDLEFAVGDKGSVWEVKDPLLAYPQPIDYPQDDDSFYPPGGAGAASSGSLMNGASGGNYYASAGSSPRLGPSSSSGLVGGGGGGQGAYGYPPPPLKPSMSGLSNSSEGSSKGWYNPPASNGGTPGARRDEGLPPVPVAGYHQSRESRGPNQGRY